MIRVVFNQKGGVGKSSIASNLAAISAWCGLKTLVVDLDPQCNTSHYLLGEDFEKVETDIGEFFAQTLSFSLLNKSPGELISTTRFENLDIIPASPDLGDLQHKLETKHKIYKLRNALRALAEYDAIYIDTPPAFNFYTLSALIAADACLIPFDCDDFSRQALYALMENVVETSEDHNEALSIEGIIVNQFQARANYPRQVVKELREEGLPVLDVMLPSSVIMKESHHRSTPLVHMSRSHRLTTEFIALFEELNGEIEWEEEGVQETETA
jgi:chromosome partitioning protein